MHGPCNTYIQCHHICPFLHLGCFQSTLTSARVIVCSCNYLLIQGPNANMQSLSTFPPPTGRIYAVISKYDSDSRPPVVPASEISGIGNWSHRRQHKFRCVMPVHVRFLACWFFYLLVAKSHQISDLGHPISSLTIIGVYCSHPNPIFLELLRS